MSTTIPRLSFLPDFPGRDRLYRPLNADKMEVRVIAIMPSSERSSPIRCFLKTISLHGGKGANHYNALSYYWGLAADTESVTVYNRSLEEDFSEAEVFEVPVTKQLTGALRQFRSRSSAVREPLVLWTDAICINQLDAEERSQQVTIMRQIFAAASSTWIWLGDGDPDVEQGLVDFIGLARHMSFLELEEHHWEYQNCDAEYDIETYYHDLETYYHVEKEMREFLMVDDRKLGDAHLDHPNLMRWYYSILVLGSSPYWCRGWVFQEACANETAILQCGRTRSRIVDWDKLCTFVEVAIGDVGCRLSGWAGRRNTVLEAWFRQLRYAIENFGDMKRTNDGLSFVAPSGGRLRAHVKASLEMTSRYPHWQTTDPRDRVYALTGALPGFMGLKLRPDYTLPTQEVFVQTTVAILQASRTWSHRQFFHPSASPYLPSWAIDFTSSSSASLSAFEMALISDAKQWLRYKADANAAFRLQRVRHGMLLTAGFVFDTVVATSPLYQPSLDSVADACILNNVLYISRVFWSWRETLLNRHYLRYLLRNKKHRNILDVVVSLCRILWSCWQAQADTESVRRIDIMSFMPDYQFEEFGPDHAAGCRESFATNTLHKLPARILRQLIAARSPHSFFRSARLIITKKGYIGLAPLAIEPQDKIAIIATGRAPFALRKVQAKNYDGDAYRLLGGCYIDGEF